MDSKTILIIAMIVIIFVLIYMFSQKPTDKNSTPYNCDPRVNPGCSGLNACGGFWGTYKGESGCRYICPGNPISQLFCKGHGCSDCENIPS
jgi:hypothetical protein